MEGYGPLPTDASERRKVQNRNAQRKFRSMQTGPLSLKTKTYPDLLRVHVTGEPAESLTAYRQTTLASSQPGSATPQHGSTCTTIIMAAIL